MLYSLVSRLRRKAGFSWRWNAKSETVGHDGFTVRGPYTLGRITRTTVAWTLSLGLVHGFQRPVCPTIGSRGRAIQRAGPPTILRGLGDAS